MDSTSLFLVVVAGIFLLGVIGELAFERTGVPDVIWLIGVGMLLGPITGMVSRETLAEVAPYFGAITLVIVLFDGGSGLQLRELTQVAPRATVLALVGFVASTVVITLLSAAAAAAGMLPEAWTTLHGVLLGTILGGSSSVVLMPALRKAGLTPKLANVLNLESAITDVLCVVAAASLIQIVLTGSTNVKEAAITLGRAFAIGLSVGGITGLFLVLVLRRLKRSVHGYPIILGTLMLLYVLVDGLGGSAALGILTVAIMAGNAPSLSRMIGLARTASLGRSLENVHDQMTFIIKSFFFTLIGAMLGPPWHLVGFGVLLGLGLCAIRYPVVRLTAIGTGWSPPTRGLITVSSPRGMAAGVLAMLPAQSGVPGTEHLPAVVFAAVITTILIFAGGFPVLRGKLPPEALDGAAEPKATVPYVEPGGESEADSAHPAALESEPPQS